MTAPKFWRSPVTFPTDVCQWVPIQTQVPPSPMGGYQHSPMSSYEQFPMLGATPNHSQLIGTCARDIMTASKGPSFFALRYTLSISKYHRVSLQLDVSRDEIT